MIYTFKVTHCYQTICLKTFAANDLRYLNLMLCNFLSTKGLAWLPYLKQKKLKLELLTDIDMLLMIEKRKPSLNM